MAYDDTGRRTQITYPDSTVVTRSYTDRDQLYQIGYDSNNVATYSYDDSGRRTTRVLGDTPGTSTTWTYGRDDNLVTAITTSGVASFGYTYDANKNKLTETLGAPMANFGFDSTTYDDENRLTAWSRVDDNKDQSWTLSDAGDWESFTEEQTTQTRTHNSVHELTDIDQTSLTYDAKGNITTNANAQTYVWDFDNRMSSYNNGEYGYNYDALGRRVSKTVVIGGGGQGARTPPKPGLGSRRAGARPRGGLGRKKAGSTSITTVFVLAGQQVLSEYKNTGSGTALVQQHKFVYASYIDEPVLMLDVDGETETKYYYHQNNLFSVCALTNQAGTVVERYSYLAYGAVTCHNANGSVMDPQPTSGSPVGNPYLFTGRRLDPETGLFYYRARYYDTNLGRFIGRDPIAADVNLYRYVHNRPTILVDPTGLREPIQYDEEGGWYDPNTGEWYDPVEGPHYFWGRPYTPTPPPTPIPESECCQRAFNLGLDLIDDETGEIYPCDKRREFLDQRESGTVILGDFGGVICCNGKLVACAWMQNVDNALNPPSSRLTSPAREIVESCILVHESTHIPGAAIDCGVGEITRPGGKWFPPSGSDECAAYKAQKKCLATGIHKCKGNKDCIEQINLWQIWAQQRVDAFCH